MVGNIKYSLAMMETPRRREDELIPSLVGLIFDLSKGLQGLVGDVLDELGLTLPLAEALWQLDPAAPPPSMRRLAAGLHCDPSTVTFLADRLIERDLVAVRIDPADRRRKIVTLTPKGATARQRLLAAMATRSSLARLSPDEQWQLHDLLNRAVAPIAPPE
jgi:DNA-binding MarR family transcriptional regulator